MGSASSINTTLGSLPIPVGTDNGTANGFVGKVSCSSLGHRATAHGGTSSGFCVFVLSLEHLSLSVTLHVYLPGVV